MKASTLAIFGGEKTVPASPHNLFTWPLLNSEDEEAVLELIRKPNFIDSATVEGLEQDVCEWLGSKYALACNSGTSAIEAALFACGVGPDTEVIVPSLTHWASALPACRLGATLVFADIAPLSLNLDPVSVRQLITPRTKAIVAVHQHGRACEMDELASLARSNSVALIEDASHAHGSRYKGVRVGNLGDVAAFSFHGKPIAAGEGGILTCNDRRVFERALAWGHCERFASEAITSAELLDTAGLPLGATTSRMHNLTAALARVQLRHLEARISQVDSAMNYFWDRLERVPGIVPHRTSSREGSTMGAWYKPFGFYRQEELGNLPVGLFVEAVCAEGVECVSLSSFRKPLHLHPRLQKRGTARLPGVIEIRWRGQTSLERTQNLIGFSVPRFSTFDQSALDAHAFAFVKVARNYEELLRNPLVSNANPRSSDRDARAHI